MATFSPFGLISCDTRTSAPWNSKANQTYQINPATNTTPIYIGDPVTIVGGYITLFDADAQTAAIAGTGPAMLGVFLGCNYNQIGTGYNVPFQRAWLGVNDVVAGTPVYAVVEDNIDTIFKVQVESPTGMQISSTYKNGVLAYNAPNTANQTSGVSLDPGVLQDNPTFTLKVVGIFDAANGGAYNANPTLNQWSVTGGVTCPNPILLVQMNNQLTRAGTPGAA